MSLEEYCYLLFYLLFPIFLSGLLEDLFRNIKPVNRLTASFCSSVLFVTLSGFIVKNIDIPIFDYFLSIYLISLLFTCFAMAGVVNSINIIDGFHGLASGSLIIMFSAFAIIGF